MGLWDWLRGKKTETAPPTVVEKGLTKTRQGFWGKIRAFFAGRRSIDAESREEIESLLLSADVGVEATEKILSQLEQRIKQNSSADDGSLLSLLSEVLIPMIERPFTPIEAHPYVILLVGVNGVGKTTTLARLAYKLKSEGKKVLMGAADTFRAAAVEQLRRWSERLDIPLVEKGMGADPGAVAYEAVQRAVREGFDVVLIDTAGRLHTRTPLMQELGKVYRVVGKALPGAPHEVLLVIDATTGQNALRQAEAFMEATHCTGLVLTKLDGTAKGGIAFALVEKTGLPIRFIGVGEGAEDLLPFSAETFVAALLREEPLSHIQ
ncbi:MAG: signal recognition particle-docking protein FtsY [Bacteroidia bacterium]|nr:signal recognition particle-docking protein FtsY [Bacteroidia bacterium]MCX7651548.1 signal recognition particle-docking protein FtsY [Bacteroidia bacterium]MDW8416256.1 signal recognition particle-docking protein FtsY [Bacteroidia bacterium]